jgi:hypothetical protein
VIGRAAEAGVRTGRDRAARVLLLLAALGALFSFGDAVGATMGADPETRVTESWRMNGYWSSRDSSCCSLSGLVAPLAYGSW